MPLCLTRWIEFFRPHLDRSATRRGDAASELDHARTALLHCMHDCPEDGVRYLQQKIQRARNHRDLWSLRSDVYHCVAMQHHEAMATERLQSLTPLFEGWVAPAEAWQKPR